MKFRLLDWLARPLESEAADVYAKQIGEKLAMKELALFIAISYIANTISKCEIKTYEGGKEVKGELYYMLNVNPNPNQNSSQFMNRLIETYFYQGEALVVPMRNSLYVADGYSMDEQPLKENVFSSISLENDTIARTFKASKVFFFRLDNREVTQLVRSVFTDYGELIKIAMNQYVASGKEKYKLILDQYSAGDKAFNKLYNEVLKDQLSEFLNSDRAVYPQYRGMDLQPMTSGAANVSDITTLRKEVFEMTAQAFKIPLTMMQGNITNMSEIVKVYLSFCIDPIAQMLSEELTRKTNTYSTWSRGNRIVVDTSSVNHIDILEVADNVDKLISSGSMCINEVRSRLGLDELPEDFASQHFVTKNYGQITDTMDALGGGETIE